MDSIFTEKAHQDLLKRLNTIDENKTANWGKMNVSQMLHHCQHPINIILQKKDYDLKPNWIARLLFKKAMYSDKLWRKNLPTVPSFKTKDDRDFTSEKLKLKSLIEELHTHKDKNDWQAHPVFGTFTKEQWGKMQYKHLDHHFRQFGV